ncbi:Uncharacterized protein DAT39_023724, partial [Clarias magur]
SATGPGSLREDSACPEGRRGILTREDGRGKTRPDADHSRDHEEGPATPESLAKSTAASQGQACHSRP